MVYSNASYKRLFLSLNNVTLATIKTTIVCKTSNNDNFDCVSNKLITGDNKRSRSERVK